MATGDLSSAIVEYFRRAGLIEMYGVLGWGVSDARWLLICLQRCKLSD